MKVAHQVIARGVLEQGRQPGVTTSEDVSWWMRQRVADMGLGHWFHPSITIHRKGGIAPGTAPDARVIQRGDMLHTDFGLVYLGLLDRHAAQRVRPAARAKPTRRPG